MRHGLWLKNKRQLHLLWAFDGQLIRGVQARHFKAMMKDAGHFNQIKKLRISDKDLVPFTAAYDVRNAVVPSKRSNICSLVFLLQTALAQLKESYRPH